jgi:SAM-dependent methyltransferase
VTQLAGYKKLYVEHFRRRLELYGEDVRALWNSAASQATRFEVLCQVGNLSGAALLDVGCGFGDLLDFLAEKRVVTSAYCGIDLSPEMVAIARARHPRVRFECRDIHEQPLGSGSFDVVVGSGLFFLPHPQWDEYVRTYVSSMFACCRRAVAVNFLSAFSMSKDPESYYATPHEVLASLQKHITPSVVLRHDYRGNDFTIYLYR